ncbi:amino acid permease [Arsenicicoccus sp. oral taxon 190]|uniref:amino acid permease n=1 Tax=Arsenicicoccus sp. oral taxon 190 TaxID=1658671 RepID=UPI00067A2481|nr:amino acid permease [Arsenicicoccus sp. oral taxon 190]AKT51357.1 gamma-aminobutyrate permease [Arsenicicoccus sp. oral taxon 190]
MTDQVEDHQLRRSLTARHLNMIAIGGAIGTGLFVASGSSISTAGPGGALVAYGAIGLMVFLLMQSLGEMSTYLPVAGSFEAYGTRFVSPSFGFATGWNYWFNWAITVAAELVAAAIVMKYWLPDVPSWLWSAIFLTLLFLLNAASVKAFGESEFWFASIKVLTVIIFLGVGVAMITGILAGPSPGFHSWTVGSAPFVGGGAGILAIFMVAGFSFQGTELVAVASGEAEEPERTIPWAIRAVFYRILLFYVGAIVVIGFLLPYTDGRLLGGDVKQVAVSPFTLVFERAGVLGAATLINAVILTSILSAGNSGMFASTRLLFGLARGGMAPAALGRVTRRGVPLAALLATTAVGALCFLTSLIGDGSAYVWLVNASGLAGFITWMGIAWSHYRFRKAYVAQGHDLDALPFRARWFPLGPLVALVMCAVVIGGQNYQALLGRSDVTGLVASYLGLPIFLLLWAGHKLVTRAPAVRLEEADLRRS